MALTEEKVLSEVTLLPQANAINVRWYNIIKRDGQVISKTPHRKAYSSDQKSEFLAEVEGAAAFVTAIGW
jgi:hypothetical protein